MSDNIVPVVCMVCITVIIVANMYFSRKNS